MARTGNEKPKSEDSAPDDPASPGPDVTKTSEDDNAPTPDQHESDQHGPDQYPTEQVTEADAEPGAAARADDAILDPVPQGDPDAVLTPHPDDVEDVRESAGETAEAADHDPPTDHAPPLFRDADEAQDASGSDRTEPKTAAQDDPPANVTVQKVGFLPLVLGGAVAAALGFGAAMVAFPRDDDALAAAVAAQSGRIQTIEGQIAGLPAAPDLAPLEQGVAGAEAGLQTLRDDLQQEIAALDSRLTALERMPSEGGTLAEAAIASYEAELDALREDFAAQQSRMQALVDDAAARLDAARTEAATVEQDAVAAAQAATARAALSRVQAALDSGSPFTGALADLSLASGIAVPAPLTAAASEGVPTMAALQNAFAPAARDALATARAAGLTDEDGGRIGAFLRSQFDVRSVTPQAGSGPDAILSRAEAALRDNRLTDALAEIETLPDVARAAMTDWIAAAQVRAEATAAAERLSQTLNEN